jgi:hypothetical protein
MNDQDQSRGKTQNTPAKKPFYKRWWFMVIGIIILYSIGSSAIDDANKNSQSQSVTGVTKEETSIQKEETPKETEKIDPQITITSVELTKEYSDNEVAADAKYKDKVMEVSGKVSAIDNGVMDNEIIIRLSDGQYDFNSTWCYMKESERDEAIALKKGQQITLIGKGSSATMKSPVIKECTIK